MYQDFVNTSWFDQCEYSNQTGVSRPFFWYPSFERATKIDEMVVSFVSTFHLLQCCKHGEMDTLNVETVTGTKKFRLTCWLKTSHQYTLRLRLRLRLTSFQSWLWRTMIKKLVSNQHLSEISGAPLLPVLVPGIGFDKADRSCTWSIILSNEPALQVGAFDTSGLRIGVKLTKWRVA